MDFNTYAPLALRTAKEMPSRSENIWHAVVGMVTEIGELADAYKRKNIYGKPLDVTNVLEELGDLCWYVNLYKHYAQATVGVKPDNDWTVPLAHLLGPRLYMAGLIASSSFLYLDSEVPDQADFEFCGNTIWIIEDIIEKFAIYLGADLSTVLTMNIDKLARRYGDKYSDYSAVNRDVVAERATLEQGSGN